MEDMVNQQLTDAAIRRLPLPATGNKVYFDADVPGFAVRVTAKGSRSFVLQYTTRGGRERRYTIGRCGDWTTTEARQKAKRLRHDVDEGGDPLEDRQAERDAPTVADLADRFEQEHLPRKRASTAADYKRILRLHVIPALGRLKVADVTFADIDRLHHKITRGGSPYRANRVIAVLSKMFALAVRWSMRDSNPCKGIEHNVEYGRRRYLSTEELARLVAALAEHPDKQAANIVRLLLLTGARRGEVLAARWADIDLTEGKWSKPPSSTKQKEHHEAPLSAPARQLLSEIRTEQTSQHKPLGEFVFPSLRGDSGHLVGLRRAWRRLTKAAKIEGLRLHDLRHSFASQLASGGASLPLIGALLGHSNPKTTHRYAHLFDDPLRAAVEKVGAAVTAAGKPGADVVPHRKGRTS
jgi:integrase